MSGISKRTRKGTSKAVIVRSGGIFDASSTSSVRPVKNATKRRRDAYQDRLKKISGMSFEDRENLAQLEARLRVDADFDMDIDRSVEYTSLPPGEEAMFVSHAGGEDELCATLLSGGKRYDGRTRHDRTQRRTREWQAQLGQLVQAYLKFKADGGEGLSRSAGDEVCTLTAVDYFDYGPRAFHHAPTTMHTNVALARQGYIGSAPIRPAVAFSFRTLEAYRQLHRVCPRLSIQGQVRALCHLHSITLQSALAEQFSIAFDVYLDILHQVDLQVNAALSRNTSNWRMLNACAPCLYKLEDEAVLKPAMLITMDGNQSLKLVDDKHRAGTALFDERTSRTDIWLTPDQVDRFKDEVQASRVSAPVQQPTPAHTSLPHPVPLSASAPESTPVPVLPEVPPSTTAPEPIPAPTPPLPAPLIDNDDGDTTWFDIDNPSADDPVSVCVDRWRNAGPEARKKMFALFAITGVFVALCRHGHLLIMCDMVKSGELMKYPLAIIDKLAEVYGRDLKIGYDVACAFGKIVQRSSLGPRMAALNITGVVPAFHGHSHNRGCQVDWHPLYMNGVGKEDFEGCERCFSESNALAAGTRLSSPFHRHQAIEQHFAFWSEQKHAESGKFILNNYRQALDIIKNEMTTLEDYCRMLKLRHEDFERYLDEERAYLKNFKPEPPELGMKIDYVESLLRLQDALGKALAAKEAVEKTDPFISAVNPAEAKKKERAIKTLRTKARTAQLRWETIHEEVLRQEEDLDIETRWLPGQPEYQHALKELGHRKYRLALDKLERLIVQRLFELTKLGMSGTGYKLREKIGKALKARAGAIKQALLQYNTCAQALSPPRDALSWSSIVDMATLADFDLLRETREDIRQKPWAQPHHRRATNMYFNVKRAREEIHRLDIEIPRLFTSMFDEHHEYHTAIARTLVINPPLARELSRRWQYRDRINTRVVQHLVEASRLPGFSAKLEVGQRVGRPSRGNTAIHLPSWAQLSTVGKPDDDFDEWVDIPGAANEHDEEAIIDYLDSLSS